LADVTPGFADATHGAQQTFRALLDAMARPGSVHELPPVAAAGIVPPPTGQADRPLSVGTAAVLLTLLDAECSVRLAGSLASPPALAYLRFHTGVRPALPGEAAAFCVTRGADADAALWQRLELGSDEAPQRGATLIVEVDALGGAGAATRLRLAGPGIATTQGLAVGGLSPAFWAWRSALAPLLPRGIELILVCGARIAAIPRTTRIELDT
jgi:alpha-D-ribose 1-methylphosphonate 5-triphosphate synthase subunit PhnH